MHLFFDTHWKLHIGEIPEKPDFEKLKNNPVFKDYKFYTGYKNEDIQQQHDDEIAAIKQNALTVGNPEIIKKQVSIREWYHDNQPVPDRFYFWPGGYEIKDKEGFKLLQKPVAILILPEKKNTMENMTKEQAIEKAAEEYADSIDRRGCAFWRGLNMGYIAGSTASGSVAAPKDEFSEVEKLEMQVRGTKRFNEILQIEINNLKSELASLRQQLKEQEEAIVGLLNIIDKLYPYPTLNLNEDRIKAIIERARKTLNKEF